MPPENTIKTILLIDDYHPTLSTYKKILSEDLGYRVLACSSFKEALETYEKEKKSIDIVLSDLSESKDMEAGFKLCADLRKKGFRGQIIVQTNALTNRDIKAELERKASLCGVDKLVAKNDITSLKITLDHKESQKR